jgi:16S rRNA processing protein RimM
LLAFEEIPDRTGAEGLRGARLVLEEAAAATDPDEEAWSEDDLLGLQVRDPAGEVLGEVTGLEIGPAQDRLVIELTDGVTAYVPFVEAIVPTIAEDHVVVDAPPGLFDLYREAGE